MPHAVTPILGVNLAEVTDDPRFTLGTKIQGNDGREWIYSNSDATAITAAQAITLSTSTFKVTSAGSGSFDSPVAVAAGKYFWARKTAIA